MTTETVKSKPPFVLLALFLCATALSLYLCTQMIAQRKEQQALCAIANDTLDTSAIVTGDPVMQQEADALKQRVIEFAQDSQSFEGQYINRLENGIVRMQETAGCIPKI